MQIKLETGEGRPPEPLRIRVPFLQQETGLGSSIAAATSAIGVKPCEPCKQRAAALDRRVVFSPWET